MTEKGEMYRAGPPVLGARLLCAANLVRTGRVVADIGCDHGKLAVWLALKGGAARVIAIDNRPLPLEKARALVRQTGCENLVDCRLGSGFGPLAANEAGEIVIAGLSGETMAEILETCPWVAQKDVHLVLVPASRHDRLRRYLCRRGFAIMEERAALEAGRCYAVMSAQYTGQPSEPDAFYCEMGDIPKAEPEAVAVYARARLKDLRKRLLGPLEPQQRAELEKLIQEVGACLP